MWLVHERRCHFIYKAPESQVPELGSGGVEEDEGCGGLEAFECLVACARRSRLSSKRPRRSLKIELLSLLALGEGEREGEGERQGTRVVWETFFCREEG